MCNFFFSKNFISNRKFEIENLWFRKKKKKQKKKMQCFVRIFKARRKIQNAFSCNKLPYLEWRKNKKKSEIEKVENKKKRKGEKGESIYFVLKCDKLFEYYK